jgi:hypothetical protein
VTLLLFLLCSLDDEVWEIRFNFVGEDNLERTLCRSDVTVLNLFALIEVQGYGIRDLMHLQQDLQHLQQDL